MLPWILAVAVWVAVLFIVWCWCVAASRADRDSEMALERRQLVTLARALDRDPGWFYPDEPEDVAA